MIRKIGDPEAPQDTKNRVLAHVVKAEAKARMLESCARGEPIHDSFYTILHALREARDYIRRTKPPTARKPPA